MIKRIYQSKLDVNKLSLLNRTKIDTVENFDYKKVVVNKPWGYEYLMFQNSYVSVWILYIKYNYHTSMHCHPNKKSSLIILSGKTVCSNLENSINRKKGEGVLIDEGVFHTTKAISKKGAFVIEIESPPNKKDLVRFKDEYGREKKGYEGKSKMSDDIEKYEYIDFHDDDLSQKQTKLFKECELSIFTSKDLSDLSSFLVKKSGILCILQGKIKSLSGKVLLTEGETFSIKDLKKVFKNIVFSDIMLLGIFHYGQKS